MILVTILNYSKNVKHCSYVLIVSFKLNCLLCTCSYYVFFFCFLFYFYSFLQFDGVWYEGAKLWAKDKLLLIKSFAFGVMNPHAKAVQQWNQFIVISCLFAIFIDPLFFYLLSVKKVTLLI